MILIFLYKLEIARRNWKVLQINFFHLCCFVYSLINVVIKGQLCVYNNHQVVLFFNCVEQMYGGVKCHRIFDFSNVIFTNSHMFTFVRITF